MTDLPDIWGIADDVDDLAASWDPGTDPEPPADAFTEADDWVRRRLAAARFVQADIARTAAAYRAEIDRLEAALADEVGAPSADTADGHRPATGLHASLEALVGQLMSYHAAAIARARAEWLAIPEDRRPAKPNLPTTIRSTQGKLRSGDPNKFTVNLADTDKAAQVVAWLQDNGYEDAVTVIPEQRRLDGRVAPGLVTVNDDGERGIFNTDGEPCPHLRIEAVPRWFKVDLPEVPS